MILRHQKEKTDIPKLLYILIWEQFVNMYLVIEVDSKVEVIVFDWVFEYEVVFDVRDMDMCVTSNYSFLPNQQALASVFST